MRDAASQTLWEQVREDFDTNLRDWSAPGFRALLVHRLGAWRLRQPPAIRKPLYFPVRTLHRYVRNRYGIELHGTATVGRRVRIAHQGGIVIHEKATIGDGCLIRQGVTIGAATDVHAPPPVLEPGVEVGAGAVIVGSVRIGAGARIGPNAVVLADVPAGAVVVAPQSRTVITRLPDEAA